MVPIYSEPRIQIYHFYSRLRWADAEANAPNNSSIAFRTEVCIYSQVKHIYISILSISSSIVLSFTLIKTNFFPYRNKFSVVFGLSTKREKRILNFSFFKI